jgi:hypothetical protein
MRCDGIIGPEVDKAADDDCFFALDREPARVCLAQRAVELAADDEPAVEL